MAKEIEKELVTLMALIESHKHEIKDLKKQQAKLLTVWCENQNNQQLELFPSKGEEVRT